MRDRAAAPAEIIFCSLEPWDEVWRRNQFVVDLLVRRHPKLRVLWLAPAAVLGRRASRLAGVPGPASRPRPLPSHPRVFVAQSARLPFERFAIVRWLNDLLLRATVALLSRRLGLGRGALRWINDHQAAAAARGAAGGVVYDVTDDWIAATHEPRTRAAIVARDAELCRRAGAVIVCSERLRELKRDAGVEADRLHLVANGVHCDHYARVGVEAPVSPPELKGVERPIYGYTGTVHAERVDVDLVEALARRLNRGTLAFVGPNHLDPATRQRLEATGRVRFVPAVSYQRVPEVMSTMAALVVPHRLTPFVDSLNPIKLWEYLASGLPVVATPVAGFRDFGHLIALRRTADDFAAALRASADEPACAAAARREAAGKHSWDARVDAIESILRGLAPPRDDARDVEHASRRPATREAHA